MMGVANTKEIAPTKDVAMWEDIATKAREGTIVEKMTTITTYKRGIATKEEEKAIPTTTNHRKREETKTINIEID